MKINELDFESHPAGLGGTRAKVSFDNGYGASIITGDVFYTSEDGPYELAVTDENGLTYETPITNDVLGYLTEQDVERLLVEIRGLPPKGVAA